MIEIINKENIMLPRIESWKLKIGETVRGGICGSAGAVRGTFLRAGSMLICVENPAFTWEVSYYNETGPIIVDAEFVNIKMIVESADDQHITSHCRG
jgi:hypothetical protein